MRRSSLAVGSGFKTDHVARHGNTIRGRGTGARIGARQATAETLARCRHQPAGVGHEAHFAAVPNAWGRLASIAARQSVPGLLALRVGEVGQQGRLRRPVSAAARLAVARGRLSRAFVRGCTELVAQLRTGIVVARSVDANPGRDAVRTRAAGVLVLGRQTACERQCEQDRARATQRVVSVTAVRGWKERGG